MQPILDDICWCLPRIKTVELRISQCLKAQQNGIMIHSVALPQVSSKIKRSRVFV